MSYREWPDDARGARGRRHGDGWLDDETYASRPDPDRGYRPSRYDSDRDYPGGGSPPRSGGRHSREPREESTGWSVPDRYDDTGAWTRGDHTGEWERTDDAWTPRPSRSAPTSDIGNPWSPETERPWARHSDQSDYGSAGRRSADQTDAYEPRSFTGYDRAPTYRSSGSAAANPYWPDTTSTPEYDDPPNTGSVYRASGSASPPTYQDRGRTGYEEPPTYGGAGSGYGERGSDYRQGTNYRSEPDYRAEPDYRREPDHRREPDYRSEPDHRREPDYRSEPDYRHAEPGPRHQMDDRTAEYRRDAGFPLAEPTPRREPAQRRDEPSYGPPPAASPPYREIPRQRATAPVPRRPAPVPRRPAPTPPPAEDERDDETVPGGYLASALYTVMWYAVPIVAWVVWSLTLNGEAAANCVEDTGIPCASERTEALSTLIDTLPRVGGTLLLSLVVAMVLRWVSESWRAATVGFAAAVVGGGAATVILSVVTGQSIG
ncbi:MAG TPA: hypothetical protein VFR67_17590 [Pilimelia sp.]|nr:hypothetical protein [Pilimelia sp.]